jgi:hypothetical protein
VPDREDSALLFEGSAKLLELLADLYPRQRRDQHQNRPLICLVREEGAPEVLRAVHERIRSGLEIIEVTPPDPRSPPPDDNLPPATAEDVRLVRDLLKKLARELGRARDRQQRIRRFRRFALVSWLMDQQPGTNGADQKTRDVDQGTLEETMRGLLRTRDRYQIPEIPNDLGVPAWLRAVAIPLAALIYRARFSGRVPVLSGYYRWFVRRDSLAPRRAGNMPSVAAELINWGTQPDTTLLFLVNSFMEDIRAAYRSPVKRYLGVRRTTCCLISVSNITRRNGGYQLLRAINEVRNLTRLPDPLLVLTEGHRQPPFATAPAGMPPVSDAQEAFDAWGSDIARAQDEKKPAAWFLSLAVPAVPEDGTARDKHRRSLSAVGNKPIVAPRESHQKKAARLGSMVVVLAAVVLSYAWYSRAHCGNGLSWPGFSPTVSRAGNECVGLADDPTVLFSPLDEPTRALGQLIQNLNSEAQARHDEQPTRPLMTLVYLGVLSAPDPNVGALAAEVEGLKGVAVAQRRQLDARASTDPLVKVVFANAGQRMTSGTSVAATIGAAARRDPTLVGVVGLNESYRATEETINALADQGIPTVAATLSTDSLADDLLMYFQIAPQNRREAAVAAAYAAQHTPLGAARAVRIYFSDNPSDIYSSSLTADAVGEFRAQRFDVRTITFTPDGNPPAAAPPAADAHLADPSQAGTDSCDFPGLVFYAGRPLPDFGSFLGAARNCARPPRILADDDVTRYVANDEAREQYPSIPFDYLAFAATIPDQAQVGPEQDFYSSYDRMFPAQPNASRSLDGHAALAYDAVSTFVASVQRLRSGRQTLPISPGTVWRQISAISGPGLRGASGYIDFGGEVSRRVPLDKPVLVLSVRNGRVQPTTAYCGPPPSQDQRTQPWCPRTG